MQRLCCQSGRTNCNLALQTRNLNVVPYGAHFAAANQDPTRAGVALPDNFYRPYPGYANVWFFENSARPTTTRCKSRRTAASRRGCGLGINNTDLTLFKNIPLGSGGLRKLQLRWEIYNAFNHTQFATVDAVARFDAAGNQVNTRFGQVITTRAPRVMQVALRFVF